LLENSYFALDGAHPLDINLVTDLCLRSIAALKKK